MKDHSTGFLARIAVLLLLFVLLNAAYTGFITRPAELDSLYYHIPIAKSYLTGDIFSSPKSPIEHRFFPGASEGILALFLLFRIPLNLFNVLAVVCLFAVLVWLGVRSGLKKETAVLYAAGFSLMTGIVRWLNVQVVDIWLAVWYAAALALLMRPRATIKYSVALGLMLGAVAGTKYSGPLLDAVLLVFFGKRLLKTLKVYHWVIAAVPVLLVGGFWYIRNYLVKGNPLYPQAFLMFPGAPHWVIDTPVWKAILTKPLSMASAALSEFLLWPVAIFAGFVVAIRKRVSGKKISAEILLFFLLALCNFAVYLLLPNGEGYRIHVSNLRYAYPVLVPAMLAVFLLAVELRLKSQLALFVFLQALFSIQVAYHPKLLILFIPLAFIAWKKMDANFRG